MASVGGAVKKKNPRALLVGMFFCLFFLVGMLIGEVTMGNSTALLERSVAELNYTVGAPSWCPSRTGEFPG